MPGRSYSGVTGYRYGFNGKENNNQQTGVIGAELDYGKRLYNPRISKFLSVDPLYKEFPWNSPYSFAEDEPVSNIDFDGLEKVKSTMSAVSAGIEQYSNEKRSEATGILQLVTSFEPYRNLWGYTKDWARAVTGNREAISKVNEKTTDIISKTSIAFATGISAPANFLSTMYSRSCNENIQGLTYYSLKGVELYLLSKVPEIVEGRVDRGYNLKSRINVHLNSADFVNESFTSRGYLAPYTTGTTVGELELNNTINVVRLSGPKNINGDWFTTMDEIKGLSPAQIKDKLSLKYLPTNMTPAKIQSGSTVRFGTAAPIKEFETNGGGFQIEVLTGDVKYGKTIQLPN